MALNENQLATLRKTANGWRERDGKTDEGTAAGLLIIALDEIERLRDKYGALEEMPWLGRVTAVGGEPRPNEFVARIRYRQVALDSGVVPKPSDDAPV